MNGKLEAMVKEKESDYRCLRGGVLSSSSLID